MKAHESISVLLVDDDEIIRTSNKLHLSRFPEISIVGECSDGEQVCHFLSLHTVDVVLMDIVMRLMDGIQTTRLITKLHPEVRVIALSNYYGDKMKTQMYSAGAKDYLPKSTDPKLVVAAIKAVCQKTPAFQ